MIVASGKISDNVMMGPCISNDRGMPDKQKTNAIVPIFKGNRDVISCGSLERQIQTHISLNKMQFGFVSGK